MRILALRPSVIVVLAVLLALPATSPAAAGPAARVAKRATETASRFTRAEWARIARLDRAAHRAAKTTVLTKPQTVSRYVSKARAGYESKHGFGAWTHFTSPVRRGRPLSATTASGRFGLRRLPEKVEKVTLPAGTRVKKVKVHGGKPGEGEWALVTRLRRAAVSIRQRVVK